MIESKTCYMNDGRHNFEMLNFVIEKTNKFVASVSKSKRKQYGQFFTSAATAKYMSELFDVDLNKPEIKLLDAGCGTGVLTAAWIDMALSRGYKGTIKVTCYENDKNVVPILLENIEHIKQHCHIDCEIKTDNYITTQQFENGTLFGSEPVQYDYIIGNPPYKKIPKDALEAKVMPSVCYGAPNLYSLFCSMGIRNLKKDGEMVYIIPRSWTSGAYFDYFRRYMFANCILTNIHLFESRNKVFDGESVLQETMIVKLKKTTRIPLTIQVTTSSTSDFSDLKNFNAPYDTVVGKNRYVFLVTNKKQADTLAVINKMHTTLPAINLPMKTGLVVDFRTRESLCDEMEEGCYPLIYSQHIKAGRVVWPQGKEGECILTDKKSYLQKNDNYLIVKRFTAKEEKRRLQCGIYLKQQYPQFEYISTQNKVNFIRCDSPCLTYGLFVLLNSTLYDDYYRILNGSTQVNSTEINSIPVPERNVIEEMGRALMQKELTEMNCNKIIEQWIR